MLPVIVEPFIDTVPLTLLIPPPFPSDACPTAVLWLTVELLMVKAPELLAIAPPLDNVLLFVTI